MAIIGIDLGTSSSVVVLRIEVKIPERLSAEERALYKKLCPPSKGARRTRPA